MAKKERSYNPAQEQHKKDKKRAAEKIKQQRQNVQLQSVSRRNPARIESQIANLKQIDAQGRLSDADRAVLSSLEKELRLVKKAKAQFASQQSGPVIVSDRTKMDEAEKAKLKEKEEKRTFKEILKNKRDPKKSVYYDEVWNPYGVPPPGLPWKERDEDDSEEVRRIPMPRDTPPAERKPKQSIPKPTIQRAPTPPPSRPKPVEKSPTPPPPVKAGPSDTIEEAFLRAGATVIEAAPVLRDFQKEAASFVPSVVKRRPPPKRSQKKENEPPPKTEELMEKSFATTVEEGSEDEETGTRTGAREEAVPAVRQVTEPSVEMPLKRSLEEEKVVVQEPPPAAPSTAPPKRRRLVNAAPDV